MAFDTRIWCYKFQNSVNIAEKLTATVVSTERPDDSIEKPDTWKTFENLSRLNHTR